MPITMDYKQAIDNSLKRNRKDLNGKYSSPLKNSYT